MTGGKQGWSASARVLAMIPALALVSCIPQAYSAQANGSGNRTAATKGASPTPARTTPTRAAATRPAATRPVAAAPVPATPVVSPAERAAQRTLEARVRQLGQDFDGETGIAVRDVETGWQTSFNGSRYFPQQSVSKFWVAITALQAVDAGTLTLSQPVTIRRQDLTLFHQPIAAQVDADGYTSTVGDLMFRAITQSDNTCNDAVLRAAGGPQAVQAMLTRNQLSGVRFGPGERVMQSRIAGLQWQSSYSVGRAFYTARDNVPMSQRRTAFENYVADPVDGATVDGIVNGLARLQRGELLSPASTSRLLSIMSSTRTGPQRLTGGLAAGWRIAHKTGTGQVLGGTQAGYNDIGILTSPDGRHYAVAVMMGRTATPLPTRMAMMQAVTRAVIAYDGARGPAGTSTAARR